MSVEDIAQDAELLAWERNNQVRTRVPQFTPEDSGYGPELCSNEDCEAVMPKLRRQMGSRLCTACQERHEYLKSRGL